ncbi:hypothetical protein B0I72DRAFT_138351 [Yarrowia lipolytica]|jgi:hypothetical protein|uniref:YALI0C06864p n=2 Tax=Yarrowia lipolytica TaxID=4952 RepID=Q6CCS8_YARLI|nr:YALI0C06864p [Yarrowia lipolytica CLIB122]AOW02452.1 hypothetical protein YALI1_C09200g [Yarrowia lipolytica]KAB8281216.1 hypothetical protein BKA91DRAFT_140585 [Yarrowia lipolytica]KAE8170360.1 hypothetical protein BKA90DRAFT_140929 [Yarrowia lipolytica]KAJ8053151.1 hypothetical protein LXG23DRAFT_23693 [Yarrowia lipolytica]QNP96466.1 Hypothetical protein YALI2_C00119g [Yarrowia lipolytica]|eukprot:XP_501534.1 YALI0C06864p [Yarrowia lipolytica CLIB122]
MSQFTKLQYMKKAELMNLAQSLDLADEGTKNDLEDRITRALSARRLELEATDEFNFLYTSSPRKRIARAPRVPAAVQPDVKVSSLDADDEDDDEDDDDEDDEDEEDDEEEEDSEPTETLAEHWARWKEVVGGHVEDLYREVEFQVEEAVSFVRYQLSTVESATIFALLIELYYLFVQLIPFQLGLRWGRIPTRVGHSLIQHLEDGGHHVVKAGWFDLNDWFPLHVVQTPDFSVLLQCKTWSTLVFWAVGAIALPATVAYFVNFTATKKKTPAKTHQAIVYLRQIDPFVFNLVRIINYYILTRGLLTVFPFVASWTWGLLRANRQAIVLNAAYGDLPLFSGAALVLLAIYAQI